MSEYIIELILEYRYLIGLAVPIGVIFMIVSFSLADDLEWRNKKLRFLGLFYKQKFHETLWLAAYFIRTIFILSMFAFGLNFGTSYIVFFILVSVVCCIAALDFMRFLLELLNGGILFAILMALSILIGYYKEVYDDPAVLVIYIVLGIFALFYSTYFYLRGIAGLMKNKIQNYSIRNKEAK